MKKPRTMVGALVILAVGLTVQTGCFPPCPIEATDIEQITSGNLTPETLENLEGLISDINGDGIIDEQDINLGQFATPSCLGTLGAVFDSLGDGGI